VPYFNKKNIYFVSWVPCSPQGILSDRDVVVGLQPQHAAKHSLDVCRSKSRTLNEMEHNVATLRLGVLRTGVDPTSSRLPKCAQEMWPTFKSDTNWGNVIFKIVQELYSIEEIRTFNFTYSFG
jgi:hypothetical protein